MPATVSVKLMPKGASSLPTTPSRPYTVSSAMPAAVCGKTIGRSMMPSMARLPTKSRRAEQIRERDADDEGDRRGDQRRRHRQPQRAADVALA